MSPIFDFVGTAQFVDTVIQYQCMDPFSVPFINGSVVDSTLHVICQQSGESSYWSSLPDVTCEREYECDIYTVSCTQYKLHGRRTHI